MTTQSRLTTVFLVGIMLLSTIAFAAPAAGADMDADASVNGSDLVQLENGDDLYLSFGANPNGMSLEEYVEAHAAGTQEANAEVIQYSDVSQVNLNVQDEAVSIAIDGGEATAVQESNQLNDNEQVGEADASNVDFSNYDVNFENVGDVYVLLGNGDNQQFDGWGVVGPDGETTDISQTAMSAVSQAQEVDQLNYNNQSTALAIAENGSTATALQQTDQYNENLQQGVSDAMNVYAGDTTAKEEKKKVKGGSSSDQSADAYVEQGQDVNQENVNEQGGAVAIAVGENSTATAIQVTDQTNLNSQYADASASNIIDSMNGMAMAFAETDADAYSEDVEDKKQDKKDDKKDKADDTDSQQAQAEVIQYQSAEQVNINMQNNAIAIATNESEATAVQMAYQENYNIQIGYAAATNVADPTYETNGAVYTDSETLTVGGNDVNDNQHLSIDYDGSNDQLNDVDQFSSASVEQVQQIGQLNLNEQHAAIAIADDGGDANAVQISMQTNENVQFGAAEATSMIAC